MVSILDRIAGGRHRQYRFWFVEWSCCGHLWQLLLSKRYPERRTWVPTCPICGLIGDTAVHLYREERSKP